MFCYLLLFFPLLDFKMTIPSLSIDVTGFEDAWSFRLSQGDEPLQPHTCDSHSFRKPNELVMMVHVISRETGRRVQLSEVVIVFEEKEFKKISSYHQEVLFKAA